MTRAIAAAAALALAGCGGVTEIGVSATRHTLPGDWNEIHPFVRWEGDGVMAAAFRNSEGRVSMAAGPVLRFPHGYCEAGLATGYSLAPIVPMGRCVAEMWPVQAFIFPEYVKGEGAALGFGVGATLLRF